MLAALSAWLQTPAGKEAVRPVAQRVLEATRSGRLHASAVSCQQAQPLVLVPERDGGRSAGGNSGARGARRGALEEAARRGCGFACPEQR